MQLQHCEQGIVREVARECTDVISAEIFTAAYLLQKPLISRKAHCHLQLDKWAGGSKGIRYKEAERNHCEYVAASLCCFLCMLLDCDQ